MNLNISKTKVMSCSKFNKNRLNINIKGEPIEWVKTYCYLGSKITDDVKRKLDMINRTAQENRAFQNKNLTNDEQCWARHEEKLLKIYV